MADQAKLLRQIKEENKQLHHQLRHMQARLDAAEDIREGVFKLSQRRLPGVKKPRPVKIKGKSRHTPILFTSDFQAGEVIRRSEMDGMNEFNLTILQERYDVMIEKAIRWAVAVQDGWGAYYPDGIIYLRGGDAISGDIHEELVQTNDLPSVPTLAVLTALEKAGIARLKEHFGQVHVISIPGNHGRTTRKSHQKGYVEHNLETIIAWWLESLFVEDPHVTFETPASGHAYFEAEGHKFYMTHGDRMGVGGGTGYIGAAAPITKGHLKQRIIHTQVRYPVDWVLNGHFHTSMMIPGGFANGSIVGYNEFARSIGATPDYAKQWLIFAHKRYVYGQELILSDYPRIQK